ncbi:helix-turn-helix domain-containing protein [Methyloceanibacter caenitepidi]|uniref:Transcriptional regulator, XRE family n=1 Tax=Methyloceanibacter caenitepidi TaxID=1384459 RepID=A0A0A8JZV5_9HYPH|nr:helix-turn-helix transcriptional regulator [Methyloceanibacter caenitepidi]BAQ15946.1 transcriptional regulator, XRE family [Methyloceanibacter caenitepidi]
MPIVVTLDLMLARRKMKAKDLAAFVGITESNLSLLRTGKVRGVRFETLAKICDALDCQPGDILEFVAEEPDAALEGDPS